jgi:hypothetical protein
VQTGFRPHSCPADSEAPGGCFGPANHPRSWVTPGISGRPIPAPTRTIRRTHPGPRGPSESTAASRSCWLNSPVLAGGQPECIPPPLNQKRLNLASSLVRCRLRHGEAHRQFRSRLGLQPLSRLPRHPAVQDRSRWTALSSLWNSGPPSDPHEAAEAEAGRKLFRVVVQVSRLQGHLPGGSSQAVL